MDLVALRELRESLSRLVGEHPQLFADLVRFLEKPKVWGYFQINRGGVKITSWNILESRRPEEGEGEQNT